MKFLISLMFMTSLACAQNLSPAEQKRLLEENQSLKEEIKFLKEEVMKAKNQAGQPTSKDNAKMMETLIKGQKYQEAQLKALEELDKEE